MIRMLTMEGSETKVKAKRRSFAQLKLDITDPTRTGLLVSHECSQPRNSYACPNENLCGEQIFKHEVSLADLRDFRNKFWTSSFKTSSVTLFETLWSLSKPNGDDGARKITYVISGCTVCKDFFRTATGLTRQVNY